MTAPIEELLGRMDRLLAPMTASRDARRFFLGVYRRTTAAVGEAIARGGFADAAWTERWDLAFADLYLDALREWDRTGSAPGPWQVAFHAAVDGPRIPPRRHLLLGMNAHINYDLPQALLAVISDEEFDDRELVQRRAADHHRIDDILSSRVAEEDRLLRREEGPGDRTALGRLLTPLNRARTRRLLQEARTKVWRNARVLSLARRDSPGALKARFDELGALSAARVADLRRPGNPIPRLARRGFGVVLAQA